MTRIVYLNGEFLPAEEAKVSIFDRAFLMGDGVYEVTSVLGGRLIDFDGHVARLERSLKELGMEMPMPAEELLEVHRALVEKNAIVEGGVYLQITRGVADRDFLMPEGLKPTVVLFGMHMPLVESPKAEIGMSVGVAEDQRWGRRDIKTVQLLYPSMAKTAAKKAGFDDAWLVEDGFVTEGTSNNAYIVTKDGRIVTRQLSHDILHGITRAAVLKMAKEAQMQVEERPFTIEEAKDAAEAFITSATTFVMPVVKIDGTELGDGKPGPVAKRLREIYIEESGKMAS
ncbi:D-amino-acid transaminase [Poseidonocella sp. HB161398]|uniref:D-amino-acid transaminase n=1 Tax=Poseidonocella sp. HB161398 TaxID=2320855 RepID=UPI001109041B|nr:D-amino-acid transaminase [Poseidonocella sp. HB161398]